jgi:hypothetical protein
VWTLSLGVSHGLPCPPPPSAPAQSVISEKATTAKEELIIDYDDRLPSYESQFRAYRT